MFIDGDQGGHHPNADAGNKEKKVDPKGAALDLLFGQRGVVGGRRRIHRLDIASRTTIMTSRFAKTYWVVLHNTTTMKVKGSIRD